MIIKLARKLIILLWIMISVMESHQVPICVRWINSIVFSARKIICTVKSLTLYVPYISPRKTIRQKYEISSSFNPIPVLIPSYPTPSIITTIIIAYLIIISFASSFSYPNQVWWGEVIQPADRKNNYIIQLRLCEICFITLQPSMCFPFHNHFLSKDNTIKSKRYHVARFCDRTHSEYYLFFVFFNL